MTFAPYLFRDLWSESFYSSPSASLINQHFGIEILPDENLEPLELPSSRNWLNSYYRPWRITNNKDSGSTVKVDKEKFVIYLDVQQFNSNEIQVIGEGSNTVLVEAKNQGERADELGYVSRQFLRRYFLPSGYDVKNVTSTLQDDGVLMITVTKFLKERSPARAIAVSTGSNRNSETK